MNLLTLSLVIVLFSELNYAKVYFQEGFNDDTSLDNWVQSKHKDDLGKLIIAKGAGDSNPGEDNGLKTSEDAKFYGLSAKFPKFTNKDKELVIQFTVRHEQGIDCGGGYVKLFSSSVDPENFHGETPYNIMFGPDICGMETKKVHVIFSHDGKNYLTKKDIRCKDDTFTHMYRLIVKPTNEFEVQIDNEDPIKGSLEDDFDILAPKMIDDDSIKKPDDWEELEMIPDPSDKKPDDWDKPKTIPDANAKKPEDWDDEMDGEWEAPQIDNPDYKGEWSAKLIKNEKYKGPWVQPKKPNPDFKEDKELYAYEDFGGIGFDLWQVKSGTIFDNIAICDDLAECKNLSDELWKKRQVAEKQAKAAEDIKMQEAAAKAQEEAEKKDGVKEDEEEKPHDEL